MRERKKSRKLILFQRKTFLQQGKTHWSNSCSILTGRVLHLVDVVSTPLFFLFPKVPCRSKYQWLVAKAVTRRPSTRNGCALAWKIQTADLNTSRLESDINNGVGLYWTRPLKQDNYCLHRLFEAHMTRRGWRAHVIADRLNAGPSSQLDNLRRCCLRLCLAQNRLWERDIYHEGHFD